MKKTKLSTQTRLNNAALAWSNYLKLMHITTKMGVASDETREMILAVHAFAKSKKAKK